jgi:hypothetical protein
VSPNSGNGDGMVFVGKVGDLDLGMHEYQMVKSDIRIHSIFVIYKVDIQHVLQSIIVML